MKPMAIVTILAAAVQVVNALTEARAGTAAPGGYSLVGVTIGLVAAVLLAVSGAALLRRGQDAATISVVSATASAALVIAILFALMSLSCAASRSARQYGLQIARVISIQRPSPPEAAR